MADRHYFVNLKKATIAIQQGIRAWLAQSRDKARTISNQTKTSPFVDEMTHSICTQREKKVSATHVEDRVDNLQSTAVLTIQNFWKDYIISKTMCSQHIAAAKIQSHYRSWLVRKSFVCKRQAIRAIQNSWKDYTIKKSNRIQHVAATKIQNHYRGWLMRKKFALKKQAIRTIQNSWKDYIINKSIQSQHVSATKIQSHYRSRLMRKSYACKKQAIRAIQNSWKGYMVNKSIRSQHVAATKIQSQYRGWLERKKFACKKQAIRTIQRIFQCLRSRREFLMYRKGNVSAIIIQSHFRGWRAFREVHREKQIVVRMQVSFYSLFLVGWRRGYNNSIIFILLLEEIISYQDIANSNILKKSWLASNVNKLKSDFTFSQANPTCKLHSNSLVIIPLGFLFSFSHLVPIGYM